MKKKGQDLRDVVGDTTHDLTTMGKDAARDLADYVVPRVRELADNVVEFAEPRARDLSRRSLEFATETRENLEPKVRAFAAEQRVTLEPKVRAFAADTRETLEPKVQRLAADTREKAQPLLDDAKKRAQPKLDDAKKRIQPLVDTGRGRFESDIRPRLEEAIANVNAQPQTQEAKKRFAAATAALAGELALPEPKQAPAKRSKRKTFGQLLLAGGLGAGVVYAIKRFLAPEDSGWQAHEPSQAYRTREDFLAEADEVVDDEGVDAEAEVDEADAPATASDPTSADPFVVSPYGEGSYVGSEPPADYAIKGNERSMKYHVVGSGGYDRTIADVWFTSEEVAEAAGFSKAQR